MIWHIVRFHFRADVDDAERRTLERDIQALAEVIDDLVWLAVARDLDDAAVTGLLSLFDDEAGLAAYREHPQHVPVAQRARALCQEITRLDVEAGSPAAGPSA